MVLIEEVRRPGDLSALTLVYRKLLPETPGASRVQALDWLVARWELAARHGADEHAGWPRVLVVRSGNAPIGVLPLVVWPERTRLGVLRILRYPWPGWLVTRGPIGPNPTATLAACLRHLSSMPRDWDVVDLRGVDVRGGDFGRTEAALRRVGFAPRKTPWHALRSVEIGDRTTDADWPRSWYAAVPRWLAAYRRAETTLGRVGRTEMVADDSVEPSATSDYCIAAMTRRVGPIFSNLESARKGGQAPYILHQDSARDMTSGSQSPFSDRLLSNLVTGAVPAGLDDFPGVECATLRLDGQPLAAVWFCRYGGRTDALGLAFTDRPTAGAPAARVLLGRWIAELADRGAETIRFGPGWPDWVTGCATHARPAFRFSHFPLSARAQAARWTRWRPAV